MLSARSESDKHQFDKSWLDREPDSGSPTREACALPIQIHPAQYCIQKPYREFYVAKWWYIGCYSLQVTRDFAQATNGQYNTYLDKKVPSGDILLSPSWSATRCCTEGCKEAGCCMSLRHHWSQKPVYASCCQKERKNKKPAKKHPSIRSTVVLDPQWKWEEFTTSEVWNES